MSLSRIHFSSLCLSVLCLVCSADAQQVSLMGEWFDQEKDWDPVMNRDWYYEYNPSDPVEPSETYPRWRYGYDYRKDLPADTNNNGQPDGSENWGNYTVGYDASCWAATASNMVRYIGGGDRYERWVFHGDWPDGSTHTWQDSGGTDKALHAEGYHTTGHFASSAVWSIDPISFAKDALAEGVPVSLVITDNATNIGALQHLVTLWEIDDLGQTITISDSDNGPDFWSEAYTYAGNVWHCSNADGAPGYRLWINGVRKMDAVRTTASGSWVTESIWDFSEVGGTGGDSLNPKFIRIIGSESEGGGEVVVPAIGGPYQSIRTILNGPDAYLGLIPGAELQLGSLYINRNGSMRTGKLNLEGTLTAQRADVKGSYIDVDGGRLDVVPPAGGQTVRADFNSGGLTMFHIGNGGEVNIGDDLIVVETEHGAGRLVVSSGPYDVSGVLNVNHDIRAHEGATVSIAGPNLDASIGGSVVLRGGWMDVTRTALPVVGDVWAGQDGSAEIDLRGGVLSCDHFRIGYLPGTINEVKLEHRDGDDPELRANQITFGFDGGETTVLQNAGYVGRHVGSAVYPDMSLGRGTSSDVTYELYDGEVEVQNITFGPGGHGEIKQYGGTATVRGEARVHGDGDYLLMGGTLNLRSSRHVDPSSGFDLEFADGTLNLTGNDYQFDDLKIGHGAGSDVVVDVANTTMNVDEMAVGTFGKGAFEQTDGSTTAHRIAIAQYDVADGSRVTLDGGLLEVDEEIYVGIGGKGRFTQDGDADVRVENLIVGSNDDSSGYGSSYYQNSGTTIVRDTLTLGDYSHGTGHYLLDGGVADTLDANSVVIGRQGQGNIEQVG